MKCGVYCVRAKGSTVTSGNAESVAWMIIDLVFYDQAPCYCMRARCSYY